MKWDKQIEEAKKDVIEKRIENWKEEWITKWYKEHKNCRRCDAPEPPEPSPKDINVKSWFIAQWDTGFCVVDMQELMKRPKKQRDKILKLGGL